ncbi:hypothetical protein CBER1_06293 [Cercospora berteroae]|uniref:Uncharacterized protein n=1 Tax=Cercospora berteroae TaxID=357750 RepID=A0A2S6BT00_9PEZI|nr:hypothetical protein CBER1_06293 [Cercospora berteroae]
MAEVGDSTGSVLAITAQVTGTTGGIEAHSSREEARNEPQLTARSETVTLASAAATNDTQGDKFMGTIEEVNGDSSTFHENTDCSCEWTRIICDFCELVEETYERRQRDNYDDVLEMITAPDFKACHCIAHWNDTTINMPADVQNACPLGRGYGPSMYVDTVRTARHSNHRAYDESTVQELRRFISDRGLEDPWPGTLMMKWYYIRFLESADREQNFDLLGLPTEMRLEIYRHVLICDFPVKNQNAILSTCKLVYREASDILYGESIARCYFEVCGRADPSAWVLEQPVDEIAQYSGLPDSGGPYPPYLLRMRQLEIHLDYSTVPGQREDAYRPLNNYLINLASHMMERHSLKTLTIILDFDPSMEETGYGRILYPLRRLRNIQNVQFRGAIPNKYRLPLISDMQSSESAYNTLRQMRLLLSESYQHIKLIQNLITLELEGECACGECSSSADKVERLKRLRLLRNLVQEFEDEGFTSSAMEQVLQGQLGALKNTIDEYSLEEVKVHLKKAEAAEKARRGAKDDPSVLDRAQLMYELWMIGEDSEEEGDWPDID